MPAKKTASRKRKPVKASRKKVAKSKPSTRKKAAAKTSKVKRKKVTAKTSTRKKTVARKKPAAKKSAKKKVAKKKAVAKKAAAKRRASRKRTTTRTSVKKQPGKKKASKKEASKKKVSKKKSAGKKKVAGKKAVSKKRIVKKAPSRKKPSVRKTPARKKTVGRKATVGRSRKARRTDILSGPIHGIDPYMVARGEEYMSQEQLDHFEAILSSWKSELMKEVDRTVHHMQDEASNFPDPNDRATQESEFGLELRTRDRERKLLRKINSALARIEEGSYGFCDETGEEIGLKRLEARPVATMCVDAQERRELAERQFRDRDDRYR